MSENKWQPVMLVADHRIDCGMCGALAIFIILDDEHSSTPDETHTGDQDWGYSAWCQSCWRKETEDDDE